MDDTLHNDLIVIVLEEAFGMHESYARRVVSGSGTLGRFKIADQEAYNAAEHAVQRFEARCSKIEG